MEAITVAIIGAIGAALVAFIEKGNRENRSDHRALGEKMEYIGKSLGISIDRVEKAVDRTELKIDAHIADHARGEFDEEVVVVTQKGGQRGR
jgi:hypothetical protein